MNSLRLLEAGTTVTPVRDETGKFRLRGGVTMPRFNQRPDATAQRPWWKRLTATLLFWRRPEPGTVVAARGPRAEPIATARPTKTARTRAGLKTGRGRLAWAGRRAPAEDKPVQAEFRFEDVRVVCNDLDDTDFIVRPQPVAPREAANGRGHARRLQPAKA